jgi:hypothetical protein
MIANKIQKHKQDRSAYLDNTKSKISSQYLVLEFVESFSSIGSLVADEGDNVALTSTMERRGRESQAGLA